MPEPPEKEKPPLASKGRFSNQTAVVAYHACPKGQPRSLYDAQKIAESILGPVNWRGPEGYCPCPGALHHTTRTLPTDCKIVAAPVAKGDGILPPGLYCWHSSCEGEVASASYALRSALGRRGTGNTWQTPRHAVTPKPRPKTEFDSGKLAKIAAKLHGIDAAWLAARSPIRPDTRTPASFLHALYEPGENVVVFGVFESQGQFLWTCKEPPFDARALNGFRRGRREGVWFLCNPVDGTYKPNGNKNPDGTDKLSRRSAPNVTSWRFMVVESDKADSAHWLAALVQMPLRIAAIYTSGGKSIHALVSLDAGSKPEWDAKRDAMRGALVTLGADPGAMSAVRLSRLPGCHRLGTTDKNSVYVRYHEPRMQTLLYLKPHPTLIPICELPVLDDPQNDLVRWASREAFL